MTTEYTYSRYRSKGGFTRVTCPWYRLDTDCYSGAGEHFQANLAAADVGTLKETWDCITPGYTRRSRKGEIIVNPFKTIEEYQFCSTGQSMQAMSTAVNSPCGTHWTEDLRGPYSYAWTHGGALRLPFTDLISESDINSLVAEAATQAWANSNGHDSDVLQDIAEWRQTVGLASVPLRTAKKTLGIVKNAWRSFRKPIGKTNLRAGAKDVADVGALAGELWLTYRFGVRPLVRDVHSFLSSLELKPVHRRRTYRGQTRYKTSGYGETTATQWCAGFNVKDLIEDTVSVRAGILIDEVITAQRYLGLDASGMLALPWELVPMSWAYDYLLNVGDFLYGLAPYLSGDPLGSWYTVKRTQTRNWSVLSTFPVGSWTISRGATDWRYARKTTLVRVPQLPAPSITIRKSNIRSAVQAVRAANLLAVALQKVARALRG